MSSKPSTSSPARAVALAIGTALGCGLGTSLVWSFTRLAPLPPGRYLYTLALPALFLVQEFLGRPRRLPAASAVASSWLLFPALVLTFFAGVPQTAELLVLVATVVRTAGLTASVSAIASRGQRLGETGALAATLHALAFSWHERALLDAGLVSGFLWERAALWALGGALVAMAAAWLLEAAGRADRPPAGCGAALAVSLVAAVAAWRPALGALLGLPVLAASLWSGRAPASRLALACARTLTTLLTLVLALGLWIAPRCHPAYGSLDPLLDGWRSAALGSDPLAAPAAREVALPIASLLLAGLAASRGLSAGWVAAAGLTAWLLMSSALRAPAGQLEADLLFRGSLELRPQTPATEFAVPPGRPVRAVILVSAATHASLMADGQTIARMLVAPGEELPIRMGEETAEWSLERPDVRATARHGAAGVACAWPRSDPQQGVFWEQSYLARLELGRPVSATRLRLELAPSLAEPAPRLVVRELRLLRW